MLKREQTRKNSSNQIKLYAKQSFLRSSYHRSRMISQLCIAKFLPKISPDKTQEITETTLTLQMRHASGYRRTILSQHTYDYLKSSQICMGEDRYQLKTIKESRGFQVLVLVSKAKCLGRVKHEQTQVTTIIKVHHRPIDMVSLNLSSRTSILNHHHQEDQLLNDDHKRKKFRSHGSAALCQDNNSSNNSNSSSSSKEEEKLEEISAKWKVTSL